VYNAVEPDGTISAAYCEISNGGWTVIQRRVDDSVDFYRGWSDYVAGFGDLNGNFWAGLNRIHELTSASATELYVSMETFDGKTAMAHYTSFSVGNAASGYVMTVNGYNGTAGDSMAYHNNMRFTTKDRDQDVSSDNCAFAYKGAWWYYSCYFTSPNGIYLHGTSNLGIKWRTFQNFSLKMIEFKVRKQ